MRLILILFLISKLYDSGHLSTYINIIMKALITTRDSEIEDDISLAFQMCLPNWDLEFAHSRKECLDVVNNSYLNIIVIDDNLLDCNSTDVIKKIRQFSEVPMLVLSKQNNESLIVEAFNMDADGYLVKPFNPLEFIARVKAIHRRNKDACKSRKGEYNNGQQ